MSFIDQAHKKGAENSAPVDITILSFRHHQAQIAVLAQVQHVGALGFDIHEYEEAVAQQFHLQDGVFHGMGRTGNSLVRTIWRSPVP